MNAHCHRPAQSPDEWAVMNIRLGKEPFPPKQEANTLYSIGLHPWDIGPDWQQVMDGFQQGVEALPGNTLVAIGECGFDSLRGPDASVQMAVFEAHLQLAARFGLPVIVHCVKWYDLLLKSTTGLSKPVRIILHGFDKHPQLAQSLLKAGYWLSFGKALLRPGSEAAKSLALVPADRFLLETDDSPADIYRIYEAAAAIRGQEIPEIRDRVWQTWTQLSTFSSH